MLSINQPITLLLLRNPSHVFVAAKCARCKAATLMKTPQDAFNHVRLHNLFVRSDQHPWINFTLAF
ncbi:Uncharacterised protein [Corynebacterium renale]|uniref:Uncharacterized protein n=1 Tax=Corynebacterium renale TaxID=1724 RepID=A0A2A9DR37_9CORY|nr:hypothetical protein ATK06_1977 [Corynebacterium renale]SQI25659.1 Uncharacterised protein [Corynebacterium renale]